MQPTNIVSLALVQAAIMASMAGYLLDVRSVRREIDRREACGQWVAGKMGEGGAFAMRTPEEKARIAAAGSDDEVCPWQLSTVQCQLLLHCPYSHPYGSCGTTGAAYGQLSQKVPTAQPPMKCILRIWSCPVTGTPAFC